MKNVSAIFALLVFASLAVIAAKPEKFWSTPMQAADQDRNISRTIKRYQNDGFEMVEEFENAYRYFAPPVGDFDWGVCIFKLKSAPTDDYSLTTTYVTITTYIQYVENADGYQVTGFDVYEETNY